jgi:RNA polymerase sigma-70 factor (ECF subfamily)
VRAGHGDNEAEDIVQNVLIAIHERRHTYDREVPVTAWAHAITRYKVIDFLRARNATRQHVSLDAAEDCVGDDGAWVEAAFVVRRLLSLLPDRVRKSIELTRLHGLSVSETAAQLGMSESAVKVNVHRGIKSLLRLVGGDQ